MISDLAVLNPTLQSCPRIVLIHALVSFSKAKTMIIATDPAVHITYPGDKNSTRLLEITSEI